MSDPNVKKPPGENRYAVKSLTFASSTAVPGNSAATFLKGDATQTNVARYRIEFIPALRHHRITYTSVAGVVEVRMVHETHVKSWEPAD